MDDQPDTRIDPAGAAPHAKDAGLDADVVVVGAGYSGMAAAYRLWRQGHSVKVVDALDRVGGRSWSMNLSDGTFVDIGAGWTGSTEHHVLRLVRELGLETYAQYGLGKDEGEHLFVARDGAQTRYAGNDFPVSDDAQLELGAFVLAIDTMALTVPLEAPWTADMAREWDAISAGVWVRDNLRDPEALAVVTGNLTTIFGLDPFAVSFLHLLWDSRCAGGILMFGSRVGGSAELRIRGGTQQVPLAIARRLGPDALVLGSPVTEIHQDDAGATVVSERATLRCARVIVAIPTCLTGFIRHRPALPADRAQLVQRTPQGSAMKVHLVYDRAFWRDAGLSGNSFVIDERSVIRQTLDAGGPAGVNEPGILSCFLDDDLARDLGRLPQADRQARILRDLVPRFGDEVANLSRTITPNYVEFNSGGAEWLRGDYASTPGPRVLTASGFGPALRAPVGRIHWAGVDTATVWYQSIEGATQAGERAADEAIAAGLPPRRAPSAPPLEATVAEGMSRVEG